MHQTGLRALAPIEQGLLTALKKDGANILEKLIHSFMLTAPGHSQEPGEQSYGLRTMTVLTLLGTIQLQRQYFYNEMLKQGRFPLDEALWLLDGFSSSVAKMMCWAGARTPSFESGSQDLSVYAGLEISGRQIQKMIQTMGPQIILQRNQLPAPSNPPTIEVMCVSVDGTGVPARTEELLGRKGKQPDGTSRTREAKVAAIYTHRLPKKGERPVRDPGSTSYIADIVEASEFGIMVRKEAFRRAMVGAIVLVFLGDGAKWVWELARVNFPQAICILDFYHAAEHLSKLINLLYKEGSDHAKERFAYWRKGLCENKISQLIATAKQDLPANEKAKEAAIKEIEYFENNQNRMLYKTYLEAGYFIGSGVVEAGCKSVVGQRLKQSGMRWSVQGARNILALRCAIASGLLDQLWDSCYPLPINNSIAISNADQLCLN